MKFIDIWCVVLLLWWEAVNFIESRRRSNDSSLLYYCHGTRKSWVEIMKIKYCKDVMEVSNAHVKCLHFIGSNIPTSLDKNFNS